MAARASSSSVVDPPVQQLREVAGGVDHHTDQLGGEVSACRGDDSIEHRLRASDRPCPVHPMRCALQDGQQIPAAPGAVLLGLRLDPGEAAGQEFRVANVALAT